MKALKNNLFSAVVVLALVQTAAAQTLPPSTVRVTTEDELRGAAAMSAGRSVNIMVDGLVTVTSGIYFPPSNSVVRMIGTTRTAGLKFNIPFDGDYANLRPMNGLELNCRQATLTNLTITGFSYQGAAIKGCVSELLDVSNCRFESIGSILYPTRVASPQVDSDTINSQCIAAHGRDMAHVSVVNNTFNRCASNVIWSHCVYVSARSILVSGNRFSRSGAIFRLGNNLLGSTANVLNNRIEAPASVLHKGGARVQPYLFQFSPNDQAVFANNVVSGSFNYPFIGRPRFESHLCDFNDFRNVTYTGPWASDVELGNYAWADWQANGMDSHSLPPVAATAP